MSNGRSVLISVLNWNNAAKTIICANSLACDLNDSSYNAKLLIIDNGSDERDFQKLEAEIDHPKVCIKRLEKNIGFTGGHNFSIRKAITENYDYIWLLNNDATVESGGIKGLIDGFNADQKCGAVSPVIAPENSGPPIAAWGGIHNWKNRTIQWAESEEDSLRMHADYRSDICVAGTAIMFRVAALREVGFLDERLFAYFDDNDIGTRLAAAGWHSKVIFSATVNHEWRKLDEQPNYFFYLMYRNELIFWSSSLPTANKYILKAKLLNQSMFNVNRLYKKGYKEQADAAMLGINDFIFKKYGAPELNRNVPRKMKALRLLSYVLNFLQ